MSTLITVLIILLTYRLALIFIAWKIPGESMNNAATFFERTERRFPIKDVIKWFTINMNRSDKKKEK